MTSTDTSTETSTASGTAAVTAALALGDDALILSHRLAEWAGHAPVLEEEVALANIALDLLGQARVLLSTAGDEDELAYLREERSFRNLQLVEQPNGDFAHTIARQLYFSLYQHELYGELAHGDGPFAPLAAKAVKETAYHRDHAEQWTLRLGDGTEESRRRMRAGLDGLWKYTGEMFRPVDGLDELDWAALEGRWLAALGGVLERAGLELPQGARHGAWAAGAAGGDCTPSPSADCSRRCSTCTAATRGHRGDQHRADPAGGGAGRAGGSVPDPELPVLTLEELGVMRGVRMHEDGHVEVTLTPTYTGCPAIEAMSADIERVLIDHGIAEVRVRTVLAPAWSTDDISAEGRRKLAEFGIAPPRPHAAGGPVPLTLSVRCPNCGSTDTELLSRFSSTACKALRRCTACREPFDHFKEL